MPNAGGILTELDADLTKLEALTLQNNQLTGAIPTTVNQLSSLTRFYASGNTNLCLPAGSTTWHNGLTYNDLLLLCKTIAA